MGAEVVLRLEGVSKRFPVRRNLWGRPVAWVDAVADVSLEVRAGETVAVVGETGAGKSTVGRIGLHLIEADAGTVTLLGQDPSRLGSRSLRSLRAKAQMIFQDPFSSFDPTLPIGVSVEEPLVLHTELGRPERQERVVELLRRVGLDESVLAKRPYEFSGGQLQRLAIARAVALGPELLVCDEPVAALDVSVRTHVLGLLAELQAELGIGQLFVTHDLSIIRHIAQRIVVMRHGLVVEQGPTDRVFTEPEHDYTRALLAAVPIADPRRRHLVDRALDRPGTSDIVT